MKILHISDLHYSKKDNPIFKKMIEETTKEKIDFCIFSGDLTDKNNTTLIEAYEFLKSQLTECGINDFYLTCGNHDISRKEISDLFVNFIIQNKDLETIDRFVNENKTNDFKANSKHLNEFNDLIRNYYKNSVQHELYTIFSFECENKKISVVSLNLAWTAFDSDSYGKLTFPLSLIYEIDKKISNSDFKFLNIHFDLNYLEVGIKTKFSRLVREVFDCIFVGHVHDEDTKELNYDENGVFISIAPCLKYDKSDYLKGFKIIEINTDVYKAYTRTYIVDKNSFVCKSSENQIPIDDVKKMQIKILESIQGKRELEEIKARKMFNRSNKIFEELFVKPILKKTSFQEVNVKDKVIKHEKDIDYTELLNMGNYIVFGKDKSGKTTLLAKLMIDLLDKFTKLNILPVQIDFKNCYRSTITSLNLDEIVKEQYNFTHAQLEKALEIVDVKILIDNYSPNNSLNEDLMNSLLSSTNVNIKSIIIMSDVSIESEFQSIETVDNIQKLFIHDITRKSIRELANRNITNANIDKTIIVEKITKMFSQLGININFWTVSIFLYVIDNTSDFKLKNSAELIDLYIERLLDKETLVLTNSKFSFENYKNYLAEVAYKLYMDENDSFYCMSYIELLNLFEKLKRENIRIVASGKDVIEYLINKNIIVEYSEDCFSFKMNGIFEYFLAYYMLKSEAFKDRILSDRNLYTSFKNEIEIYSGLRKNDSTLLQEIYNITDEIRIEIMKTINMEKNFETRIQDESKEVKEMMFLVSELKKEIRPMSFDEKDDWEDSINPVDNIETVVKIKSNQFKYNLAGYIEALRILGRVYRNIDEINDRILQLNIFSFLVEETCLSITLVLDQLLIDITNDKLSSDEIKKIDKLIRSFTPVIAHSTLFDFVAHPTLSNIIQTEIDRLKLETNENQFKLFVLYFMLIEIDLEENLEKVNDLIEISKHWNILNSIYVKLVTIILFRCDSNTGLVDRIKKSLELVRYKMYPNSRVKQDVNQTLKNILLLKGNESMDS